MRAWAVIGASYGDEGKGRTIDWLAARPGPAPLVVRSNGGAQAAHTVVHADGWRHVFHHVGSATLRGARTHLSRFMVSHPMLFADECAQLRLRGATPRVTADPRGAVTTPWDMMINQAVETARGGTRHGSCGLGFGETVGRCEQAAFALRIADLHGHGLRQTLRAIRDGWFRQRVGELELAPGTGPLEFAWSDALLDHFLEQCAAFARQVPMRPDADIGDEATILFEAAQGLLLDQNAPGFPYLTRSNTGMANISAIAKECGLTEIAPIYVTRAYLTRHGRGPMEDERAIDPWYAVDDPTNRPNPWQESLRFGLLAPASLGQRIRADLALANIACHPALALTCLDQAAGRFAWLEDRRLVEGPRDALVAALTQAADMPLIAAFRSPVNDAVDAPMTDRDH